jgi:hypothetical protein
MSSSVASSVTVGSTNVEDGLVVGVDPADSGSTNVELSRRMVISSTPSTAAAWRF